MDEAGTSEVRLRCSGIDHLAAGRKSDNTHGDSEATLFRDGPSGDARCWING